MVGPALVLVEAGGGAVSDRVADHHHAACAGCGLDFNPGQEQACGGGGGSIQVARQALVAAGDPTGLAAVPVEGPADCRWAVPADRSAVPGPRRSARRAGRRSGAAVVPRPVVRPRWPLLSAAAACRRHCSTLPAGAARPG
ncbi:hypothetical protein G6F57_014092 [Rhizopus arrhizus]|nr:hypothetical protein G6F57_014092 [Rhizopus arrhizus]